MIFVSKLSDKDKSVCLDERAAIEALSWVIGRGSRPQSTFRSRIVFI